MNDWTPEKLARFIEVNGYNPTTQEGMIKHIDELLIKLDELSDIRDAWQKRMDLSVDEALRGFQEAHKDVEYYAKLLQDAKALLGEIVYNEAKGKA